MPIKLARFNAPRLPRLGKIKLGLMVSAPGKKPYPRATEFFVIPEPVQKVHGEKPKELPIMFHSDRIEDVYTEDLKAYKSAGLWCLGDAERAKRWGEDGKLHEIPCPCPMLESGECRAEGRLVFLLPEVVGLGVWELRSGSPRALREFKTALAMYAGAFAGLRGIPFRLTLEPEETQRPQEGGRGMAKTTIYAPHIRSDQSLMDVRRFRMGLGAAVEPLMLEASLPEEPDDHPDAEPIVDAEPVPAALAGVSTAQAAARVYSQHNDPAPPEAAHGKLPGDVTALLMDEIVGLAQRIDVDAETTRAWLEYVFAQEGGLMGTARSDLLAEKIAWLREVALSPVKSAAAKAAIKGGARRMKT